MGQEIEMRESTHELTPDGANKQSGCQVSMVMGFFLVLLAILIAVGVGLIVFFAAGGNKDAAECLPDTDRQTGSNPDGVWWPDKDCLTTCIADGYCSSDGSKPATTKAANPVTTPTNPVTTEMATDAPTTAVATTTTAAPSDDGGKIRDVRLPTWLVPLHYEIDMKPDIYQLDPEDFTNTGSVMIQMECKEATKTVTIHVNKLDIKSYRMVDQAGSELTLSPPVKDDARQFVNFTLQSELVVGETYNITLGYSGKLDNDLAGLYYSSYDEVNNVTGQVEKRYIATTQYQATDARKAFPCFDEPGIKATFSTTLWRKQHMVALSNMPLETTTIETDGWVKDKFEKTVPMSTYLLAMIVCDFDKKEANTTGGTHFRVWSRKSAIDQVDYALDQGVRILSYFEDFFNESFPLPKTDMIAIPDFAAGAMENWGLITYRETALLYDPQVSAATNKQRVAVVVSHELAHQWFGNLVTPLWWDDLWLNEGFASYVEYIGVNHTEPSWQMMDQFVVVDVHNTLRSDSLATSHPIYVPVQHPDEVNEIFDSISYGKGGSLIRMMRYFLGDSVFQQALANYIKDKAYQAAFHDDLWKAMQDEADRQGLKDNQGNSLDIKAILDTWILQMGYPVIDISIEPTSGNSMQRLSMRQSHFLQDDSQIPDPKYPSPYGYKWDVPLSYATSASPNFDVDETSVIWFWKDEASVTIEVPDNLDWMIVNPREYGFYRVNYPEPYWQKLIDTQKRDHTEINELNRAQILDDAFNLALAGKLSITWAMELTKYLGVEDSYFPWDSAISSLDYVDNALQRTEAYGDFKTYYKSLITPFYNKHSANWMFNSSNSIIDQYRQADAISRACKYDVGDCRQRAVSLLSQWMADNSTNPVNPIDPNVRSTVYCNAIREGGVTEWDFIFNKFTTENVAGEQVKLLQSLGCTNELWLLQRLLDYAIDDTKVRKQDSYIAVGAVASNTLGKFLAWDWLRGNWDQLYADFSGGIMMIGRFVTSVTRNFFTQFDLDQIENFTKAIADLGPATRSFAQAKEGTQANIKYLERNLDSLSDWLRKNTGGP